MQVKGFDISALMDKAKHPVWVRYNDDVRVAICHLTRERFAELLAEATTHSIDGRTGQKTEILDNLKLGELVGIDAISDWEGLVVVGTPFPCNADNIRTLMRKWSDFARFVSSIANNLDRLVEAEKETTAKNLQLTSGLD